MPANCRRREAMHGVKRVVGLLVVGARVLGSGYAFAAASTPMATEKSPTVAASKATAGTRENEIAPDRIIRGHVTAVAPMATPPTVTVKVIGGQSPETVAVEVPSSAKITSGKVEKRVTDITIGSRIWMRYDRLSDRLVADQIHLLPAMHAKAVTGEKKAGAAATPASAKTESSTKS
jgi:hypothetical protein